MQTFTSTSETETAAIGFALGKSLRSGMVVGIDGPLGSGKTRLTKGIALGLDIDAADVTSPTYTICIPHEGRLGLLHVDAYRINDPTEVDELGLDESVELGAVLIVEWATRIKKYLPPLDLVITIEPTGAESRQFRFQPLTPSGTQLVSATFEKHAAGDKPTTL